MNTFVGHRRDIFQLAIDAGFPVMLTSYPSAAEKNAPLLAYAEANGLEIETFVASPNEPQDVFEPKGADVLPAELYFGELFAGAPVVKPAPFVYSPPVTNFENDLRLTPLERHFLQIPRG